MAVPGFANFLSEYQVIQGALTASLVFAIAIIAPALTVGYFLWMLRRTVFANETGTRNELGLHSRLILVAFLVPLIVFGIYPGPLLSGVILPTVQAFLPGAH
jgi:NADH:ubiquinone oxidoreductase subunit 4 (subunit M)